MKQSDFEVYIELQKIVKQEINEHTIDIFIRFLHLCAARLERGDSVQAIWNDFLRKAP